MAIQLLMRKDGVEFDLIDVGTLALPHGTLTELLVQLRKTIDITKSIQQKGAILYQKFDKPPDRYSADFPKLLKIRYENEAHPLRWFLLQLSLPTLLKVSHDHTIKCLEDNEEHLKCFAEYAESNTELKQNFVDRAMKVLTKDCRDRFNRDYLDYQVKLLSSIIPESLPSSNNLPPVKTAPPPGSQLGEVPGNSPQPVDSRSNDLLSPTAPDRPANRVSGGNDIPYGERDIATRRQHCNR